MADEHSTIEPSMLISPWVFSFSKWRTPFLFYFLSRKDSESFQVNWTTDTSELYVALSSI